MLKIPENITAIGGYAFKNCTGFTNISYKNGTGISVFNPFENVQSVTTY